MEKGPEFSGAGHGLWNQAARVASLSPPLYLGKGLNLTLPLLPYLQNRTNQ
jgi:hypothetical protein